MKYSVFVLLSLLSLNALAHPGHGQSSFIAHAIEHGIWYLLGFVLLGLLAAKVWKLK